MSSKDITDELVRQVADELRARYGLDEEDVRTLGARLAAWRLLCESGVGASD